MSDETPPTLTHSEEGPRHTRRLVLWVVLCVGLGALAFLVLALLVSTYGLTSAVRHQQQSNTSTLDSTNATLKIVKDCTQPKGKCYKDGQSRTATAVQDIGQATTQASIYAAYCVKIDQTQSISAIEKCVKHQFALAAAKPKN